jgi:hypothetical protein
MGQGEGGRERLKERLRETEENWERLITRRIKRLRETEETQDQALPCVVRGVDGSVRQDKIADQFQVPLHT